MTPAEKALKKLSNTFDDDDATDAVDDLIRIGADAIPSIIPFLTVEKLNEDTYDCEPGERLYYVLKAVAKIGDASALQPVLQFIVAVSELPESGRRSSALTKLAVTAKEIAPDQTGSIPEINQYNPNGNVEHFPAIKAAAEEILASM